MATQSKAFLALCAALAGVRGGGDARAWAAVDRAVETIGHLIASQLATIKVGSERNRACAAELQATQSRARELAARVRVLDDGEAKLRGLINDARKALVESRAVQAANAEILHAERERRITADTRLAGAERLVREILATINEQPDAWAWKETRAKIYAWLGEPWHNADGPVGGLLEKLGK